jgi:putative transposase
MLGFKTFVSARCTLRGNELMHKIKKGQMIADGGEKLSAAGQFYSLAA